MIVRQGLKINIAIGVPHVFSQMDLNGSMKLDLKKINILAALLVLMK